MRTAAPRGDRIPARDLLLGSLLIAAGLALRWAASLKPLWLDEIWTLNLLPRLSSPLQILTAHLDTNNHHLNTLYLYFIHSTSWWPAYRLHSLAAGTLAIPLAGLCARRLGRLEAWAAAALTAFSYPLVHYSSEARGYSMAVCFALAAILFFQRFLEKESPRDAAGFCIFSIFGLLAHLEFIYVLGAAGLCAWIVLARRQGRLFPMRSLVLLGGAPLLVLAALYLEDLRFASYLGTRPQSLLDVTRGALSLCAGGPEAGALSWAAAAVALTLTLAGLAVREKEDEAGAGFSALLIFALPAASVPFFHSRSFEIRYWLIPMAFAIQLEAVALVRLWRVSPSGRVIAAAAAAAILAGSLTRTAKLIEFGRGDCLAALDYMSARSNGASMDIGGDNDFRDGALVGFYAPLMRPRRAVVYRDQGSWPSGGVDWVVIHSFDLELRPPSGLRIGGLDYAFAAAFPYAGLSGFTWCLFKNARRGEGAGAAVAGRH